MIGRLRALLSSAAGRILLATAIGGGSGYLLTVVVAARLGGERYAGFGVFWSVLFFVVSVIAGLQQEVARAARPRPDDVPAREATARQTVLVCGAIVLVVASGLLLLTAPSLFRADAPRLSPPIVLGLVAYVMTATLVGMLYGLGRWTAVAVMVAGDGLLRLVVTGAALAVTSDSAVLAWTVVLPFGVVPAIAWLRLRPVVVNRVLFDVRLGGLLRNVGSTVVGAIATGVLVSGFGALLAGTSPGVPATVLGATLFALNLTRAPLVIVVMSLQSYLVVQLRDSPGWRRRLAAIVGAVLAASAVLAGLAWLIGPPILSLFGRDFAVSGGVVAAIVASGGLVGAVVATGSAAIARSRHLLYAAGWVAAALVALAMLLLPIAFEGRLLLSLAAPVVGLAVHSVGLSRQSASERGAPPVPPAVSPPR